MKIDIQYPNVIVFHHNDPDGVCAAMLVKRKFDNSLMDPEWESNVYCVPCSYGGRFTLDFFKSVVEEKFRPEMKNVVYMVDYSIEPNEDMLKFWNWLTDKGCEFQWVDHHMSAIENAKHYGIPGIQSSAASGCENTHSLLSPDSEAHPLIRMIGVYDTWKKDNGKYGWDTEICPLHCFVGSLGSDLNDNKGELVTNLNEILNSPNVDKYVAIGRFIHRSILNKYKSNVGKAYSVEWNGYRCLVLNTSDRGSQQFEGYEGYEDFDLLIAWSYDGRKYSYGVYTPKKGVDAGDICRKFLNGGGHPGAAGGWSEKPIF